MTRDFMTDEEIIKQKDMIRKHNMNETGVMKFFYCTSYSGKDITTPNLIPNHKKLSVAVIHI